MRIRILLSSLMFILINLSGQPKMETNQLLGSWKSEKSRLEVLDGFVSNKGAVISIQKKGKTLLGTWVRQPKGFKISVGWDDEKVKFQNENTFTYDDEIFVRDGNLSQAGIVTLKKDPKNFIQEMISRRWRKLTDKGEILFKTTFSNDSGVREIYAEKGNVRLESWGISSGVMKISSSLIIQARITENYLIGLDEDNDFYILERLVKVAAPLTSSLREQREEFFNGLLTGSWLREDYQGVLSYKFRPITDELKGVCFVVKKDKLERYVDWEYSPSSGGIKMGYEKYKGAMIVGNTLVLMEQDGNQNFWYREAEVKSKRFTISDVRKTPLNENSLDKISEVLNGQFQNRNNFMIFEFNQNKQTGFAHLFRSEPFKIEGASFQGGTAGKSSTLYEVEDFVLFDTDLALKRDSSLSRMKPKSEEEAKSDINDQRKLIEKISQKNLVLRLTMKDGENVDIDLPVEQFSDLLKMEIVTE